VAIPTRLKEWVTGGALDLICVLTTDRVPQRFCREAVGWKALCHPNVLPLLGVMMTGNQFAMISEWTVKGSINEFVKDNNVDRLELVCPPLKVIMRTYH